jgi:hypothetical protein
VAAFAYRDDPPGSGEAAFCISTLNNLYRAIRLRLREPAGGQQIVDAATGTAVGVLGSDQPGTPSYVPDRYAAGPDDSLLRGFDPVPTRRYTHGDDSIEIRACSATSWTRNGTVTGHGLVGEQRAVITDESYERCLSWQQPVGVVHEVCSVPGHHRFLSPAELLRMADSLR